MIKNKNTSHKLGIEEYFHNPIKGIYERVQK